MHTILVVYGHRKVCGKRTKGLRTVPMATPAEELGIGSTFTGEWSRRIVLDRN
jgi:hypothetical protein